PSTPLSSAMPSRAAISTSPPRAADISTTTGRVFASPMPSTPGANSATSTAPNPSTSARTAATRTSARRPGWIRERARSAAATPPVRIPTQRLGSRCSRPSAHDSTTAGGRYTTSSTASSDGAISDISPLHQRPCPAGRCGRTMWTARTRSARKPARSRPSGSERRLDPDDAPPHPHLLPAPEVQARARMLPAPVLRLLRQLRADLPDGGAPGHGEDLVFVVLGATAALDGQIPVGTRIGDMLDSGDEGGAGSDQRCPPVVDDLRRPE